MTSIAFSSIFLGLVLGMQTVGVIVDGPVASVEYQLDGQTLGRAVKEPWSVRVDFGEAVAPHELVARALDAEGHEVSRARQWLNLPRERAEAKIVLERNQSGRAVAARLAFQSLVGSRPAGVRVTFDGKPLLVADTRVVLPRYDERRTHLLSAEMEFSEGVRSRADVVLGGGSEDEAKSELTAIAVRLTGGRESLRVEDLRDLVVVRGRPAGIVAVEAGPAQVIIVRDRGHQDASKVLGGHRYLQAEDGRGVRGEMRLPRQDRWRFLWPVARHYPDARLSADLFDESRDFTASSGGLHWLLTRVYHPEGGLPRQRFADATAVAGLEAFASSTRRAVVLLLGAATDSSRFAPALVRGYLEKVRVPLYVWSLQDPRSRPDIDRWGAVEDVGSLARLKHAFRRLKEDLASQRIVWVEGKHLPQEIALSEKASGVELVR